MQRIVLDTNSLIQSIPPHSKYRPVWDSLFDGRNLLCVSTEILEEYTEILQRLTSSEVAEAVMNAILKNKYTIYIDPHFKMELISQDQDDNKFVDCAFAANAKYIVTNDHHFDVLKAIHFPELEVITLQEFYDFLYSSQK